MSPPPFDIQGTLGALSVSVLVSCFLFGIVTLQAYNYYLRFAQDRPLFKLLVVFVWSCELAHSICVCHLLYYSTVSAYGNEEAIVKPPKSLSLAVIFSGLTVSSVQIFFAERIRVLSDGRLIIPVICWTLSSTLLALSILTAYRDFQIQTLIWFEDECKWLVTSLLCIGATADIIITASLCYNLKKLQPKAVQSFNHSDLAKKTQKIIKWGIETGLTSSLTTVALIVSFRLMPHNFIWLGIFICSTRVFSNSLVASLNGRSMRSHVLPTPIKLEESDQTMILSDIYSTFESSSRDSGMPTVAASATVPHHTSP